MVAVVGDSGSGKSRSLKNLNWQETALLDTERKGFPFDTSKIPDGNYYPIKAPADFDRAIMAVRKRPEIKVVALDSLTALLELEHMQAAALNKGYDIFNVYNGRIRSILNMLKSDTQISVVLAIPGHLDVMSDNGGQTTRRFIFTIGQQWRGMIEKEFLVVLYTTVKTDKATGVNTHQFATQTDGISSAKCPEGMFPARIDNDLAVVIKKLCPEAK